MSPTLFISSNFTPFSLYLFPLAPPPSLYPLILSLPISMSLSKQSLSHYSPLFTSTPISFYHFSLSLPSSLPPILHISL